MGGLGPVEELQEGGDGDVELRKVLQLFENHLKGTELRSNDIFHDSDDVYCDADDEDHPDRLGLEGLGDAVGGGWWGGGDVQGGGGFGGFGGRRE